MYPVFCIFSIISDPFSVNYIVFHPHQILPYLSVKFVYTLTVNFQSSCNFSESSCYLDQCLSLHYVGRIGLYSAASYWKYLQQSVSRISPICHAADEPSSSLISRDTSIIITNKSIKEIGRQNKQMFDK